MHRIAVLAACATFAYPGFAAPCFAATPRAATSLASAVVHVSDLFDDAGPGGAQVLGRAPQPGTRVVVEMAQLAAIARQFGVDWRPGTAAARVVLERAGRMLPREAILRPLRAALADSGAPADAEIELPGFTAPMVASDGPVEAGVEQIDYDAASGRFTAAIVLTADATDTRRLRVSGHVEDMRDVPVPLHRIAAGVVIGLDDLRMTAVRASLIRGEVAQDAARAIGQEARRGLPPGQPIALADIARPAEVRKGGRVTMELEAPGLALALQGVAMQSGALGERISVLNATSRIVVEADIVGRDRVRVAPGSVPSAAPDGPAGRLAGR